jgi:hypothetical protein
MTTINYNDRYFVPVKNSENGEASSETVFHYRQESNYVWATYQGGAIKFGTLIAKVASDGSLDMRYQHISETGEFMSGVCNSEPEILPTGHLRLHESWRWTSGDQSEGNSIIEEVTANSGKSG